MTGDEHYLEAERLVTASVELIKDPDAQADHELAILMADTLCARAQVHATLALAAASFEAAFVTGEGDGSRYAPEASELRGTGYGR